MIKQLLALFGYYKVDRTKVMHRLLTTYNLAPHHVCVIPQLEATENGFRKFYLILDRRLVKDGEKPCTK